MRENHYTLLFAALLLIGGALRFAGLTRGSAEPVLPEHRPPAGGAAFYRFQPDEEMVIRAALDPALDPLHPPLTVYGVLPVYLLRGALAVAGLLGWGGSSLEDPESARRIYYLARTLAALFSCGVLWLVWTLGKRYFSRPAACMAVAITALAPGAIQQAHFFIVDGLFVLLSAGAVCAALRALDQGDRRWHAIAGALIGATAAVRLNGLLLGAVLLAGHLARRDGEGGGWRQWVRRRPELWLAGGVALLILLLLEPFLLIRPEDLWRADQSSDFALAVKVTRGEVLQPWTLVDVHTIPYLDHWRLWSLIAGWPLTFVFLPAIGYVLWRRTRAGLLMALWCGLCFVLIGQLQVKAVRYLMPVLPFMALFAGAWLAAACGDSRLWVRRAGQLAAVLVVGHLAVKGLAFARIYLEEDSRVQAGRWLARHVPRGSRIGVEGGGFSMQGFVSSQTHEHVILDVTRIFYTSPYLSCGAQLDFLQERFRDMDYVAVVDVNRHAQFTAVPEMFPVVAGLYQRLVAGELGFELAQNFKIYPALFGITFKDDGAEPSFLGYDHPAVWIFKSRGKEVVAAAFARWEARLEEEPCCPDRPLRQAVELLHSGDWSRTKEALHTLAATHPDLALGHRLLAEVHRHLGEADSAAAALARYRPENQRAAHIIHLGTVHYLPANTALSFLRLGLNELALQTLEDGVDENPGPSALSLEQKAESYLEVAREFFQAGDLDQMEEAVKLSTRIFGIKEAYNILAVQAQQRNEAAQALKWWEQSLLIDANQADIHRRAGLVALVNLGQLDKARYHLARAIQLDPALEGPITAELNAAKNSR